MSSSLDETEAQELSALLQERNQIVSGEADCACPCHRRPRRGPAQILTTA
jgi:hypothetical protein